MATVSKKTYYRVTAALMALLGLTLVAYFLQLGGALGLVVAYSIAAAKALLIILFFMHVRYGSRLTMVVAAAGFFWLLIMFVLTFSDYLTRV